MDIAFFTERANNSVIDGLTFITHHQATTVPYVVFLIAALFFGTFGNICVIGVVITNKELHSMTNVFIVNLAFADLIVTFFVDSFSLLGVFIGEHFFEHRPTLCIFVASFCLTSCYCSLLTIGAITIERYVHICHYNVYQTIFNRRKVIVICATLWVVSFLLEMPNFFGWGGHRFNQKAQGCYFDWEADYSYACFFILVGVFVPLIIIAICYIRIYIFVRRSKWRLERAQTKLILGSKRKVTLAMTRTMFCIFIVFIVCWTPFSILMIFDRSRTFPFQAYIFAVAMAHSSSSWNSLLYGLTNRTFRNGYIRLLRLDRMCCAIRSTTTSEAQLNMERFNAVSIQYSVEDGINQMVDVSIDQQQGEDQLPNAQCTGTH